MADIVVSIIIGDGPENFAIDIFLSLFDGNVGFIQISIDHQVHPIFLGYACTGQRFEQVVGVVQAGQI